MRLSSALLSELATMHTYRRPYGTPTEQAFIDRYLAPLGVEYDRHNNMHLIIGDEPRIVFSSHTDTVHDTDGMQRVDIDRHGILTARHYSRRDDRRWANRNNEPHTPDCLGADDTAGVFLMRQMILNNIHGHYIFHYGEEHGCIGSRALATHDPAYLAGRTVAIAFDRKGDRDVITHQCGTRTCSDTFARSLAYELGGRYAPSDRGVYTDTREYSEIIAECTNVSVGYANAHSSTELLDTDHIAFLLSRLLIADWDSLVVERDPEEEKREREARWRNWTSITTTRNDARTYLDSWECLVCGKYNRNHTEVCLHCYTDRDYTRSFFQSI